jgi:hypothetical protein
MTAMPAVGDHRATRIALAQATLAVHLMDPETGDCTACRQECPCPDANDAANALIEAGLPIG